MPSRASFHQPSLAVFFLLLAVLVIPLVMQRQQSFGIAVAVVLGALLAVGAVKSAPPLPSAPTEPYDQAPEMCRPPYRPSETRTAWDVKSRQGEPS